MHNVRLERFNKNNIKQLAFHAYNRIPVVLIVLIFALNHLLAQSVYKTPSGARYHLASCHMVENVSRKLVGQNDIRKSGLDPCKICEPPYPSGLRSGSSYNKSEGVSNVSSRCRGTTQAGTRCKHMTRIANGFCYQHTDQYGSNNSSSNSLYKNSSVSRCGARTQSGGSCRRKVKEGGYCYQHE